MTDTTPTTSPVPAHKTEGAFRVDVMTSDGSTTWAANALRFDTEKEAYDYALDLFMRWFSVTKMRIVASDHPDRETYVPGSEHPRWA